MVRFWVLTFTLLANTYIFANIAFNTISLHLYILTFKWVYKKFFLNNLHLKTFQNSEFSDFTLFCTDIIQSEMSADRPT